MTRPLSLAAALAAATILLAAPTLFLAACGDSGSGSPADGGPGAGADAADAPDSEDEGPDIPVGAFCLSSDECPGQFCDKRHGGCVDCYLDQQCPDNEVCIGALCTPESGCGDGIGCAVGVCDTEAGHCVGCTEDADCGTGLACVGGVCRPPFPDCEDYDDCAPLGAACLETGQCGDCEDDTQCGNYEACQEGMCVPDSCFPGIPSCVGNEIQICRATGDGYDKILCPDGQTCFAGECVESDCTPPGSQVCEKFQLKVCQDNGTLLTKDCGLGQECIEDSCQAMRHRVLVVFDTSGSMNWMPGTQQWLTACGVDETDCCLNPWPVCEAEACSTLARSQEAFSEFFKLGETEQILFALQRFPQVLDRDTPSCEGGYYSWQNEMSGDDGAFTVPLGIDSWFEQNLEETVLVPFPASGSSSAANLLELNDYMDGIEFVVDTDEPCQSHSDCESGKCLGTSVVGKTCRIFANPELRAEGATPLGKSLYYAGEYMRHHVVIDGKPCEDDTECGSPGYFCGENKKCFDPHRQCRLNAIVLFTDGGETEHPFVSDYWNPVVQAKRMRLGLGCGTDDDCTQLDVCMESEDPEIDGCHPVTCHPTENYCTYKLLEEDNFTPVNMNVGGGADSLIDYNGNKIDVTVTVVDASVADPGQTTATLNNNRLIALYGGGRHVVVQVDDLDQFFNELQKTIDFKQLFLQCTQQGADGG